MVRFLPLLLILFLFTCTSTPLSINANEVGRGQIAETATAETRPNILFLFTDDHAYDAIGALGNSEIKTPNLDRIVNGGTTFTHTYNMGGWDPAICMASRAMLNTGSMVWRAEKLNTRRRAGDTTAMARNWAPLMKEAGYSTFFSGKWHVAAPAQDQFETTSHIRPGMPPDGYPFPQMTALFDRHNGNPPYDSVKTLYPPGYNRPLSKEDDSWHPSDTQYGGFWDGGKHWSEMLGDNGVRFLETATNDDRPFFMYLAFNAPHDPRQAPKEYVDMYNSDEMQLPISFQASYPYAKQIGLGPGCRDEDLAPFPRTQLAVKTHKAEYYALITHLDAQVGRILEALEASGKADNTVIMFTADHGLAVGRHGFFGKQNMYDHSVRPPMAIMGPGFPKGKKVDADVYLQDVMPTALELAGVDKPDQVELNSLIPLASGKQASSSYPAIYGAYTTLQRSIRIGG
jgi:arylsulfatase A-like enzyme